MRPASYTLPVPLLHCNAGASESNHCNALTVMQQRSRESRFAKKDALERNSQGLTASLANRLCMIAHNYTHMIQEAAGSRAYIDITCNRCNGNIRGESLTPYHYIVHNKVMPQLKFCKSKDQWLQCCYIQPNPGQVYSETKAK